MARETALVAAVTGRETASAPGQERATATATAWTLGRGMALHTSRRPSRMPQGALRSGKGGFGESNVPRAGQWVFLRFETERTRPKRITYHERREKGNERLSARVPFNDVKRGCTTVTG